jgi:hypothetical protein
MFWETPKQTEESEVFPAQQMFWGTPKKTDKCSEEPEDSSVCCNHIEAIDH